LKNKIYQEEIIKDCIKKGLTLKYLILCHFDEKIGPKIFLQIPQRIEHEEIEQIPLLMDLYDEGFFIHMFGEFKTANYIFTIPSKLARGGQETLLITIVIPEGILEEDIAKDLLAKFVTEFQSIKDVYLCFHDDQNKYEEVKNLFYSFYKSIPEETTLYYRRNKRIFVFGLSKSGKAPIIEKFREIVRNRRIPNTDIDLSEIFLDEILIMKYEASGTGRFDDFWTPYLKQQDALVFVLDLTQKDKFQDAKETLHKVANIEGMENLPLLIIFNRADLEINVEEILPVVKLMDIGSLPQNDIKYFIASENIEEELARAFAWLVLKITEREKKEIKLNVGVLFSSWTDEIGLELLGIHPKEYFSNLQEIAIRLSNIYKSLFIGLKSKNAFFILPLAHLNLKAAILIDYSEENNLKIILSVFFEESIPSDVITNFSELIHYSLSNIKKDYSNGDFVEKELKELYGKLIVNMENLRIDLSMLKKAEHRYESIFNGMRDALLLFDYKTSIILDVNQQAAKMINKSLEDIIGTHPLEFLTEDEFEKLRLIIMMQTTMEDSPPAEVEMNFKDREPIHVEIVANKIHVGGQNTIMVSFRDITERIESEKIIRETQERNKALINAIPEMIAIIDRKGRINFYKRPKKFFDVKLFAENRYLNKKIDDILPPNISQLIFHYIENVLLQLPHKKNNSNQIRSYNEMENNFQFKLNYKKEEFVFKVRMFPYGKEEVLLICAVEKT